MKKKNYLIILIILCIPTFYVFANKDFKSEVNYMKPSLSSFIKDNDKFIFFGLASYYNEINHFIVKKDEIKKIDINGIATLKKNEYLAVVKRLNVMLIQEAGLTIKLDKGVFNSYTQSLLMSKKGKIKIVPKSQLSVISPELEQIRYFHLWSPLAELSKLIEYSLILIQTHIIGNWGMVIIVFSIMLKLLMLPLAIFTTNLQRKVSRVQSSLAPTISYIKKNYDGEEAHNLLMAAHKKQGVSPFYTLKPIIGSLIQIPILIAVFNALAEMPQFLNQPFLWIKNLAYPDVVGNLPFIIPLFGNTINLLPFIMTLVTLYSIILFKDNYAPEHLVKRQKINLYLMAAAFFILFYPFPAVMVLYWTINNFLHIIQQQFIKI